MHAGASFDTPATRATQDARAAEDVRLGGELRGPVERAMAELGIEWKNVMAFGVHRDRVVVIEGPVGFKRTWWFPGARAAAGAEG